MLAETIPRPQQYRFARLAELMDQAEADGHAIMANVAIGFNRLQLASNDFKNSDSNSDCDEMFSFA